MDLTPPVLNAAVHTKSMIFVDNWVSPIKFDLFETYENQTRAVNTDSRVTVAGWIGAINPIKCR